MGDNIIDEKEKSNLDKLDFYCSEKIKVHIDKLDKTFVNGFVIKKVKSGVYKFIDDVSGEIFIFVSEVYRILEYKEREAK